MAFLLSLFSGVFGFFGNKLKTILLIASVVALLGSLGYVAYLKYEVATTAATIEDLATQRDIATETAKKNAAMAAEIQAHVNSILVEEAQLNAHISSLQEIVRNAEVDIAKSSPSDNGPLAPVLRNVLKRLRELDAAAFSAKPVS